MEDDSNPGPPWACTHIHAYPTQARYTHMHTAYTYTTHIYAHCIHIHETYTHARTQMKMGKRIQEQLYPRHSTEKCPELQMWGTISQQLGLRHRL